MTARQQMSELGECRQDAAAYALGALTPEEAERFRGHLSECVVCRDELAAFRPAVDSLALAVPPQPLPRGLRRRVLRAIREERRSSARESGARARSRAAWRPSRAQLALGALVLAALATVAAVTLPSGAGSARTIRASVASPRASAQLRLAGDRGELLVRDLPAPGAGRIYEIWLKSGARAPRPTRALFGVTAGGAGDIGVPGSLHGVSELLVTSEPLGGSVVPTRAPLIVARL